MAAWLLVTAGAGTAAAEQLRGNPGQLEGDPLALRPEARRLPGGERGLAGDQRATTGRERRLIGRSRQLQGGRVRRPVRTIRRVVRFRFDRARVRPRFHERLERLKERLGRRLAPEVRVDGHTDLIGEPPYNTGLSLRRAQRTCEALREALGRPGLPCEAVPHGAALPQVPNLRPDGTDDRDGRRRNRRAEITIRVASGS